MEKKEKYSVKEKVDYLLLVCLRCAWYKNCHGEMVEKCKDLNVSNIKIETLFK